MAEAASALSSSSGRSDVLQLAALRADLPESGGEALYDRVARVCDERYGPGAGRPDWRALEPESKRRWREAESDRLARIAFVSAGPVPPATGVLDLPPSARAQWPGRRRSAVE
jgi:hypothetical protein